VTQTKQVDTQAKQFVATGADYERATHTKQSTGTDNADYERATHTKQTTGMDTQAK
jgi:hypothetical protein